MTAATRKPLSAGQTIVFRAGFATITLQNNGRAYTVTTELGAYRVEDWCRPYATEAEARQAARHAAKAFAKWGTDTRIGARRTELVVVITDQERRMLRRMHGPAVLAEARTEADTLRTLHDLALLAALRACLGA